LSYDGKLVGRSLLCCLLHSTFVIHVSPLTSQEHTCKMEIAERGISHPMQSAAPKPTTRHPKTSVDTTRYEPTNTDPEFVSTLTSFSLSQCRDQQLLSYMRKYCAHHYANKSPCHFHICIEASAKPLSVKPSAPQRESISGPSPTRVCRSFRVAL
jgi:hypothetical protein